MRSNREILAEVYRGNGMRLLAEQMVKDIDQAHSGLDSSIVRTALMAMQLARDDEQIAIEGELTRLHSFIVSLVSDNRELSQLVQRADARSIFGGGST